MLKLDVKINLHVQMALAVINGMIVNNIMDVQ
jgi:hypothetical protein